MKRIVLLLSMICFCFHGPLLIAQTDLGSWTGVKLATKLDSKYTLSVNPIWRMKDQLSTLNTTFIDIDLKRSVNNYWFLLKNRSLLQKDTKYNHWIFADVGQKGKINAKILWSHRFRYHWGLKLGDIDDVDLLRYEPALKFLHSAKLSSRIAIDAQYKVFDGSEYFRTRYQAGAKYAFNKKLALDINYWFDDFINANDTHLIVSTLSYNIERKKKEAEEN